MRYGSVCSGIEAATVAWHPLGWKPSFFSEIEAFPRAVLSHHYPDVPLHGDFTTIKGDEYDAIDLLVGGTPCQSFSVAGLRGGLADERGNLALEYLRLANRTRPRWLVWENVPGVLSSNGGRDFGAILGGMVELGYGFAYRVLDAQHFGVPQRRRRVFVVGYLGDWRPAAAVLFERHSLQGHSAPRRQAGKDIAPTVSTGARGVGDFELGGGLATSGLDGGRGARALTACHTATGRLDPSETTYVAHAAPPLTRNPYGDHESREDLLVAHSLRGEGFDASEDGTGRGTPLVPVAFSFKDNGNDASENLSPTLRSLGAYDANGGSQMAVAFDTTQITSPHDRSALKPEICHTLSKGAHPPAMFGPAVRRLTPRECERLQGFPDGYTSVPYRGKPAADGPRYKALGNSMAVPCMRFIGERIQAVEDLLSIPQLEAAE